MSFLRPLSRSTLCQALKPQARHIPRPTQPICRNFHRESIFDSHRSTFQRQWRKYSTEAPKAPNSGPQSSRVPPKRPGKTREQMYKEKNRALLMYTTAVVCTNDFRSTDMPRSPQTLQTIRFSLLQARATLLYPSIACSVLPQALLAHRRSAWAVSSQSASSPSRTHAESKCISTQTDQNSFPGNLRLNKSL